MQNPAASLSPSLTAAAGSVLGVGHLSAARYEAPGGTSDVSSYDLSRTFPDPRYHNSYGSAVVDRSPQVAYDCSPQSYETPHLEGNCNGYSSSFDNCRTVSLYRSEPHAQPFKQYWSNGNTSDYHHHLPQTVQQSYEGNNICPPLPASSPSHTSPVLTPRRSPQTHPSSWSLSPRTTPSPQIASPGASHSSRSPAHCASPYQLQPQANGTVPAAPSHPLHSLQQMVDPESSNSSQSQSFDPSPKPSPAATIGMQAPHTTACYSNAGDSTSSPYPTYYNMDQNRLCSAQEVSVQRGGGSSLQEKQVRNGLGSEIRADGRVSGVLPPQPEDVNQKTSYYPHSTANGATPDTHTPLNGTISQSASSSATTTAVAPAAAWNGSQWSGNTGLRNGQSSWPVNGTSAAAAAGMYSGNLTALQAQQPLQSPQSQPQAFAGTAVAEAGQGLAAAVQHCSPSSWPAGDATHALPSLSLSLPGGAPGQVQKKKRGRPFGSKNKPKNPALLPAAGSSATPPDAPGRKKPGRKPKAKSHTHAPAATIASADMRVLSAVTTTSEDVLSVTAGAPRTGKKNAGPFIRVDNDRGLPVYTIANCAVTAAGARDAALSVKPPAHLLARSRRPNDAIASKPKTTSSTPSTSSSVAAFTPEKDCSWICVFCKQGPHVECLGDLFGPYFVTKSAHHSPSHPLRDAVQDSSAKSGRKRKLSSEGGSDALNNSQSPSVSQDESREVWFHEDCISWSSGVYLVGHSIRNMEEIVRDSADSVCSSCGLNGANLGCIFSGCQQRYHFLCARKCSCDFNEENYSILCDRHKDKFQKRTENTDSFLSSTIF